jgi:hypothetical protein
VLAILGCYTHFFFALLVAAHFLAALVAMGWHSRPVRALLGVQVLVALAYAPWVLLMLTNMGEEQVWKTTLNIVLAVPYTLVRFAVGYAVLPANYEWRQQIPALAAADAPALALAAVGFGAATLAGLLSLARKGAAGRAALVTGIGPFVLGTAVSFITIVVGERYFIVVFPIFLVILAAGLVRLAETTGKARVASMGAVAALVLATSIALWKHYRSPAFGKEEWRAVAETVRAERKPGELVVLHRPFIAGAFRYYFQPASGDVLIPNDDPGLLPAVDRLWLVVSHGHEATYLAQFATGWRVTFDRRYTRETGIRLLRLERIVTTTASGVPNERGRLADSKD